MNRNRLRLRVYGRRLDVERIDGEWRAFYVGVEGKRRPATDIVTPADTPPDQVASTIADLLHEWATPRYPHVEVLSQAIRFVADQFRGSDPNAQNPLVGSGGRF